MPFTHWTASECTILLLALAAIVLHLAPVLTVCGAVIIRAWREGERSDD